MSRKPGFLRNLLITRVDLVDKGANQDGEEGSHVVLFKRAPEPTNHTSEEGGMKNLSEMTQEELVAHAEAQAQQITELTEAGEVQKSEATTAAQRIETLEAQVAELRAAAEGAGEGEQQKEEDLPPAVQKHLDDARTRVEAAEKRAQEAEEVAKAERTERRRRDFVAKATELKALPGTPEENGELLLKAADAMEAVDFAKLEARLQEANELIEKGVLSTTGVSDPEGGIKDDDAYKALSKKADEIQAANPHLTFEQAFEKAVDQNKDLVRKHREAGR